MIPRSDYIIRGTTPEIEIGTTISLVGAEEIYVTLKQGEGYVERTKDTFTELEDDYLAFKLTQEETLSFDESGRAGEWQIRAVFSNADRDAVACDEGVFYVGPIIKEGVI